MQRLSPGLDGTMVAGCRVGQALGERAGRYTAFEAVYERTSAPVVLKLIDPALARRPGFRERFLLDLMLQAPLRSTHVVRVLDGGTSEHGLFLVTQRPGSVTLAELHDVAFGAERVVRLVKAVAEALDRAHDLSLVHGSLQPAGIWLEAGDCPQVDDFCFSGAGNEAPWAAPEQLDGSPPTPAADVYALGAVAYHLLTRARPPAAGGRLNVPRELEAPLRRALSAEPGRRPASAGQLAEALARAVQGTASAVQDTAPAERRASPPRQPSPLPAREARPWPRADAGPAPRAGRKWTSQAVRRRVLNAAGAALAATAALVGLSLAQRDSPPAAPAPSPVSVRSGPVALTAPPGWKTVPAPAPGFAERYAERPVVLSRGGTTFAAGPVAAEDRDFVRAALTGTRADGVPVARPVTLGDLPALRYSGLRPAAGDEVLDLYALRTSAGVITATCAAGAGEAARASLQHCGAVAASLELRGAVPLEVRPSAAYNAALAATLGRVEAARTRQRPKLATPTRRAPGAAALARAFAAAARTLEGMTTPPIAELRHAALAKAVARAQRAYADLVAAARRSDVSAYRRRASVVARAEDDVRRAVLSLQSLGYRVA